ncbi:hypothetical protein Vretimale_15103, partial [Volvox reticuliferus]
AAGFRTESQVSPSASAIGVGIPSPAVLPLQSEPDALLTLAQSEQAAAFNPEDQAGPSGSAIGLGTLLPVAAVCHPEAQAAPSGSACGVDTPLAAGVPQRSGPEASPSLALTRQAGPSRQDNQPGTIVPSHDEKEDAAADVLLQLHDKSPRDYGLRKRTHPIVYPNSVGKSHTRRKPRTQVQQGPSTMPRPVRGLPLRPTSTEYDAQAVDFGHDIGPSLVGHIQRTGIAVVNDYRLRDLATSSAAAARSHLRSSENSTNLFEYVVRNPDGAIVTDSRGRVKMSRGTRQRRHILLQNNPPVQLRRLWKRSKYLLKKILLNMPCLRLSHPALVGNKPGTEPVDIQSLHVAAKPGSDNNFLAIIPLEIDTTLLVVPFSPAIVKYYVHQVNRIPAEEASEQDADGDDDDSETEDVPDSDDGDEEEEDQPAQGSTQQLRHDDGSEVDISSDYNSSDYDQLESDDSAEVHRDLPESTAKSFANVFSHQRVLRLRMRPGQIVLLDGNTIHAGDAGQPDSWSTRLQVSAHSKKSSNTIWPIEGMHHAFARKFGYWSYR